MASLKDRDDAAKARIISHMNADHQDSLQIYLEHYKQLASYAARTAKLEDVTLEGMKISSDETTSYDVPFVPPLFSYRDVRERVVQMDQEARQALGRSDITIKEYRAPKGFHLVVFVTCIVTFVSFSRRSHFLPGSYPYDHFLKHSPGFANFCATIQPLLISIMTVLHVSEATWMAKKCAKHSIPLFTDLWWAWVGSTFIEGYGAYQRFDAIVSRKQAEKDKRQH